MLKKKSLNVKRINPSRYLEEFDASTKTFKFDEAEQDIGDPEIRHLRIPNIGSSCYMASTL